MKAEEIGEALAWIFDRFLLDHGFVTYMRDYELMIDGGTGEPADPSPSVRYLFRCCVAANVTTGLSAEVWSQSLDDILVHPGDLQGEDPPGYVWGNRASMLYPGAQLREESPEADRWTRELGIPFYEALIETDAYRISLIFSDLSVVDLGVEPSSEHD